MKLLTCLLLVAGAYAQTLLIANPTVIRANFSVVYFANHSIPTSSLQFTITASPGQITSIKSSTGSAAAAVQKSVSCTVMQMDAGKVTCEVGGNIIPFVSGTLVNFVVTLAQNTVLDVLNFTLFNLSAMTPVGGSVLVTATTPGQVLKFSDNEVPVGVVDGTNVVFTLSHAPTGDSLLLWRNGLKLTAGVDFTLQGKIITFLSVAVPQSEDLLTCSYRYYF